MKSREYNKVCLYSKCARKFRGSLADIYCSTKCRSLVVDVFIKREKSRAESWPTGGSFYLSGAWKSLRVRALRNGGHFCRYCGRKPPAVILHVDHIKPRSKFPELELVLENLQVLCADCNEGKGDFYEEGVK